MKRLLTLAVFAAVAVAATACNSCGTGCWPSKSCCEEQGCCDSTDDLSNYNG